MERVFSQLMDRIEKQLSLLNEMLEPLENMYDKDTTTNMIQNMVETNLKNIISTYYLNFLKDIAALANGLLTGKIKTIQHRLPTEVFF